MKSLIRQYLPENNSGFTLVELIVVIGILGILSAVSLPALINPEHKARKAARELMGDMQQTRMSAIKENKKWAIVFDPANNRYLICSDKGSDGVWSATADNVVKKTVRFADSAAGVKYGGGDAVTDATDDMDPFPADFVSYSPNVLTFNSRGTCSAGYVYLTYGNVSYAIGTLSTGLIRIKRWTGSSWK
ncbi:MAG: GspH/FimT family pseudopilin [Desulfobacteraceae bacterium]|nr:GspH/FimT family pseudopilin [Desulfobacteraceae bacterium]